MLIRVFAALMAATGTLSFESARSLYFEAVDGQQDALRKAEAEFEALHRSDPSNVRYSAYIGAMKLLESAKAFAPWTKGRLAKEGLTRLDAAVAAAPEDVEIRFVRATATFHLPPVFKRESQAAADLEWLAQRILNAAERGRVEPRMAAAVMLYQGILLERRGNRTGARAAWQAAHHVAPHTRSGREAQRRLN